ncbi:5'/3'-nucleotidase SurE [Beijerinckia indica]|uniref:5'-nucleotidase SurE n=1 Tax=Beijerinckia indica subsp. indica (strain ATCC 9039 / DSM 1715 / NCIMB 8712) TaxID=395963 RepID=SURE_BEII9|nr:5'/3'-nucleotidase SurE [Beijerinckia indica]B2IJG0.1 RecName: Full=5'-nucleotidase SurE; AltName: Full=Nucleoside 5'-monophosphate phosphohydrolase [Beijerinckia indica subsp. indica ATCC 9039]ACB96273.1 stationary-phase survival protein SurE [Beijerinckia indica subsp. indica ATCC 9039]
MRILITNDDGINAPGLAVLERIASALSDDVFVVAPESDQSGVAHSLSLSDPLRLRKISDRRFAVKGTPTDCVIMGVRSILIEQKPDLVLSGVNCGQNLAEDVIYSGTVAGAMEGTILGIPSIALSQCYEAGTGGRSGIAWDCAEVHAPGIIKHLLETGIDPDVVINLNFPACPASEVTGLAVTAQGRRDATTIKIDPRQDGRGLPYYWIAFARDTRQPGVGTDLEAVAQKRIALTPLRIDLTDDPTMTRLAQSLPKTLPKVAG